MEAWKRSSARGGGKPASSLEHRQRGGLGFTLTDILVAIAVMSLLIGLLLPALSRAREAVNRVKCASNIRQMGMAMQMYAQDHGDKPPESVFAAAPGRDSQPQHTIYLRLDDRHPRAENRGRWDGLGLLYAGEYAKHPRLYYCPSHSGNHPAEKYSDEFLADRGAIAGNYQYRLIEEPYMTLVDPETSLIADAFRTKLDYNHGSGNNVLRADHSVTWYQDEGGKLMELLESGAEPGAPIPPTTTYQAETVWALLDGGTPAGPVLPGQGDPVMAP